MAIIVKDSETIGLSEFSDKHNFDIVVKRSKGLPNVWIASSSNVFICEGFALATVHGRGNTPDLALYDYANNISCLTLEIHGGRVEAPTITHEPNSKNP